ncbi:MAG: hypothetical protein J2P49_03555 [Methylocapsa sp.]|nr:hypothetical protein [Methylocapsa sp.]
MRPRTAVPRAFTFAALASVCLLMPAAETRAAVQISGGTDAVKIEADDASLEEIFAALSANYGLKYHCPENIGRSVSGTYLGPLGQVLSRLLQGYNFAFESSPSGLRLRIYDLGPGHQSGIGVAVNAPAEVPPPPPRQTPLRPDRPGAAVLGPGGRPAFRPARDSPPLAHRPQAKR